jgi:hypothetical protein
MYRNVYAMYRNALKRLAGALQSPRYTACSGLLHIDDGHVETYDG